MSSSSTTKPYGFVVLEDDTVFAYKVDNYYSPENDRGMRFNDAYLEINWILDESELKLSEKDTKQPSFKDASHFDYSENLYA